MVDRNLSEPSIVKQCMLLGVCRAGLYYEPIPASKLNLELMRIMDEHYLRYPFKGAPRMHIHLTKDLGYPVSKNRVDRLYYDIMGLRAIFPGPHTSKRRKNHKVFPYLLRDLKIDRRNQVWATDITYIPMSVGYMYLIAIIDLYSRYVVNWSLSNTMDAQWCADCFLEAIGEHGEPEIQNTDQGSQFTSEEYTAAVLDNGVKLSMDGVGRATDNAFIENLWKMVKYEHIYLKPHMTAMELYQGLKYYFDYYNTNRRHSSIGDKYPMELYSNYLKHKGS